MAKLNDVKKHQVKSGDNYFFDNNIWIFLFAPIANSNKNKQQTYSSLLSSIQTAKATIFISSLVIAEFANFCLRLSFKQWKEKNGKYDADYKKDYIPTTHYKDAVEDVKSNIEAIQKITEKRPDDFNALEMKKILKHTSNIDFNDSYYAEFCALNKLKIVTDDKDFGKLAIDKLEVITMF